MPKNRWKANTMRDRLSREHRHDSHVCKIRDKAIIKASPVPKAPTASEPKQTVKEFLATGGTITKVEPKPGRFDPGFNQKKVDKRIVRKTRVGGGVRRRGGH